MVTTKTNLAILIKVRQYNLCSLQSLVNVLMGFPNRMSSNLQAQMKRSNIQQPKNNTSHKSTKLTPDPSNPIWQNPKSHCNQVKNKSIQTKPKSKDPILRVKKLVGWSRLRCVCDLSWTHGGFKGRETVVKGTENGDNVVCDGLALLQRLSHHGCFFTQQINTSYCHSHLPVVVVVVLVQCFLVVSHRHREDRRKHKLLLVEFFFFKKIGGSSCDVRKVPQCQFGDHIGFGRHKQTPCLCFDRVSLTFLFFTVVRIIIFFFSLDI